MAQVPLGPRLGLRLLGYAVDTGWCERVHRAVEKEIARGQQRLDKLRESQNNEAVEAMNDEECDQIEELLGIAFVASQAFMNRVWNQVQDLNEKCKREFGKPVALLAGRQETFQIEGSTLAGSSITNIEGMYGVGNYWKHSDEWPTCEVVSDGWRRLVWDMSKMRPIQKPTAELVSQMGLRYGSTGNLRTAARALGVSDYADLRTVRRTLAGWAEKVQKVAQTGVDELTRKSTKLKP